MKAHVPAYWMLIIIAIAILAYSLKPDPSKKLLKAFKKELQQQEQLSQKKVDSVESLRQTDRVTLIDSLAMMQTKLDAAKASIAIEIEKRKTNDKALDTYRNSTYDGRFDEFSNTYNKKDPRWWPTRLHS